MPDGEETYELAQFNIARLRFLRDAYELDDYRARLQSVMPVAEQWPGFVWVFDDEIVQLAED